MSDIALEFLISRSAFTFELSAQYECYKRRAQTLLLGLDAGVTALKQLGIEERELEGRALV